MKTPTYSQTFSVQTLNPGDLIFLRMAWRRVVRVRTVGEAIEVLHGRIDGPGGLVCESFDRETRIEVGIL